MRTSNSCFEQPSWLTFWSVRSVSNAALINNVWRKKRLHCSYRHHAPPPLPPKKDYKKTMCLRFPAAVCTDSNTSYHKTGNHKKPTKKQGSFPSKQKRHRLVCNDGLQLQLNGHVHNGYLIEFQSEWAQSKVMQFCIIFLKLVATYWRTGVDWDWNGEEMTVVNRAAATAQMFLSCLFTWG